MSRWQTATPAAWLLLSLQLPPLLLRVVAVANPTVRELLEMQYQFAEPFIVDSTKITRLGLRATPVEQALADTLAAYRPATAPAPHR